MSLEKTLKLRGFALAVFIAATFLTTILVAKADDDNNMKGNPPKLWSITEVTSDSALLPIKAKRFSGETVNAIVSVKDMDTGDITEEIIPLTLDDKGEGSLWVKDLDSDTDYGFKVRIMRMGEDVSTKNSDTKEAKTTM